MVANLRLKVPVLPKLLRISRSKTLYINKIFYSTFVELKFISTFVEHILKM
ncbi:hypothetical protein DSM01_742 [Leeuwenhoekiella palythoae]|uniref:Uncharacterized protein n=1 Tax=Leeuwenhoekiella palythoae TaxID=573501 RepID=A0ABY0D9Q6_9FLAO|nr:hypothetical protein DSM01_742 [Leeuwenhoekiella palythoae]